jgi:glycosyltransferase involved in cell wall biosynthesis
MFAYRLAVQLSLMGHIIADADDYDVHLAFIEPTRPTLPHRPLVQRLDGIWFKPEEFATKNSEIKRCYRAADAVVWQSEFDKNMTTRWWGEPRHGQIIRNGVPKRHVTADPSLLQFVDRYDKVFVCSANWHAQKRLRANVDLYMHLRASHYPSSCLIILGAHPDVRVIDQHVVYAGSVAESTYLQVYSVADWMLHLAWLDHCPNVVVEALSQGTPVVCSSDGGTRDMCQA